jgi:hypothetical protein
MRTFNCLLHYIPAHTKLLVQEKVPDYTNLDKLHDPGRVLNPRISKIITIVGLAICTVRIKTSLIVR